MLNNIFSLALWDPPNSLAQNSYTLNYNLFITGLVEALVDSAADGDFDVRGAIFKSVVDIGRRKHGQVLEILHDYLSKHKKVGVAAPIKVLAMYHEIL